MTTSTTPEWATPQDFYDALDREFGFTLDVAASADNAKCDRYFTEAEDGLSQEWAPAVCWMNPPYGRTIEYWVAKAAIEAARGATVVGLVPSRTDTRWWHSWVMPMAEIRYVKGRIRFSGHAKDAPFPSAIVVWRP
jgi:site-specific DNA-methyltransferase (adenine-specific)